MTKSVQELKQYDHERKSRGRIASTYFLVITYDNSFKNLIQKIDVITKVVLLILVLLAQCNIYQKDVSIILAVVFIMQSPTRICTRLLWSQI